MYMKKLESSISIIISSTENIKNVNDSRTAMLFNENLHSYLLKFDKYIYKYFKMLIFVYHSILHMSQALKFPKLCDNIEEIFVCSDANENWQKKYISLFPRQS